MVESALNELLMRSQIRIGKQLKQKAIAEASEYKVVNEKAKTKLHRLLSSYPKAFWVQKQNIASLNKFKSTPPTDCSTKSLGDQ